MDRTIAEKQTYEDGSGSLWAVTAVVPAANQLTLRSAKGFTKVEAIDDFQRMIVEGAFRQTSPAMSNEAPPQRLVDLTPKQRELLDQRKRIVDYISARLAKGMTWDEIEEALRSEAQDVYQSIPSRRQLHRWVAAHRKDQLAPGKPGWRRGRRRVSETVRDAVDAVVRRHIARGTRELLNLETLLHHVNAEMRQRGHASEKDALSHKALKEILAQREAWGEDLRSYLPRRAYRAITRVARQWMDADRPLEVVEIDAMVPSFHFFSPDGERIGAPTIYVAVDVATGCVLGIKAYAMAPGVEPLMDFLEHMFYPKPARPDGWTPPWGRPERVLSDQGSEFRSSFAAGVAFALLYEHLYAEGEAGWKKPHVERVNGTTQERFLKRIPGSTYSQATGKLDTDLPLRTGGPTLEKLNDMLQEFAWDVLARESSDRLRIKFNDPEMTPAKAWDRLIAEYPPMLPIPREDFFRATYEFLSTGKLSHDGLQYDNLDYSSDTLVALYQEIGPSEVEIYGSPMDAGTVLIKHKPTDSSATALSKQQQARGLSRRSWKQTKKFLQLGKKTACDHEISIALSALINRATDDAVGGSVRSKRNAAAKAQSFGIAERVAPHATHSTGPTSAELQPERVVERQPTAAVPGRTSIVAFNPKAVISKS